MRRDLVATLGVAWLVALAAPACAADAYPNRVVSLVVPYPPGGSVDGVARILAQKLGEATGATFIVDNRAGGAAGTVGANYVAKAEPDGYTLMLTASIHVVTPFLYKTVPYDVVRDFTPVSLVASGPLIVSTAPNVPASTLKDFFALVRQNPEKYTFATSGIGSAGHLAIELLKREAGLNVPVITYRGAGPALTDLAGGQIQLMADPVLSSLPLAKSGTIKPLAITSLQRIATAPNIPTVAESGMAPLEFKSWYGLWGPKSLPGAVVDKLQSQIAKLAQQPDVKQLFQTLGFDPIGSTPDYFATYIGDEMVRSEKIIRDANIKIE